MRRLMTIAIISIIALAASAQVRTVSGVGIVARPQGYYGRCPARIDFVATIHVNRYPTRVKYEWLRSDGARGAREIVDIRTSSRAVRTTWSLGGGHDRLRVWEQLHVVAPSNVRSPHAVVHVNCR